MAHAPTLLLFNYDWDAVATDRLAAQWPSMSAGFDLFSFPSNARLAWFDMERFARLHGAIAKARGARAVMSNHEQFGALCAALIAERMGWPGTPVNAILACQHKLYARHILQRVAPEANTAFAPLPSRYGEDIPDGLTYPAYVKPVKAAFSVLARKVQSRDELQSHTRFAPWELWVIRHLVEPFEKLMRLRLPQAGTAHRLMLEAPVTARQYSLDGYVFRGEMHTLGVVDSVMYPGTDCFMRFDYPGHLSDTVKHRAADVARRFLQEVGFDHGLFNMEFFYDEDSDKLTVIEFNPRMASQFADLYERVDGINLHAIAFHLAHGEDPATAGAVATVTTATTAANKRSGRAASSFVFRSFDPAARISFPDAQQQATLRAQFPDSLLFTFPKDAEQIARDFKWLRSYRYGILHLGADSEAQLRVRCQQACDILGWPLPYASTHAASPSTGQALSY
jgi:hypothetical protein